MKHLARTFFSFGGNNPESPDSSNEASRECNTARGIILGVVIGLAMWAGLVWLVVSLLP